MFGNTPAMPWSAKAEEALNQAIEQMPGPKMLAGTVRGRLRNAAEDTAKQAGHAEVQPEDLMAGILNMLPPAVRAKIEERMKEGPEGLKKLQDDITNDPSSFSGS